jgi:predicted nuclease of predicted toxin-antitoxin system
MRVLLDESLPRKLAAELPGHVTQTVQKQGWSGLKNGELLRQASTEFDVFLTGDQNLAFQQNTTALPIAVVVLVAVNNRIETLRLLIPALLEALQSIGPGQLFQVGIESPGQADPE